MQTGTPSAAKIAWTRRLNLLICSTRWFFTEQASMSLPERRNNFDFIRILAAFLVLFSHQFALTGQTEFNFGFPYHSLGGIGVLIFFSLSGFLIAQSWDRDPHIGRFAARRLLRIWPGLCVVTLLTVCVLGPLISTVPTKQYFLSAETREYFLTLKLTKVRFFLPGVFDTNPHQRSVNGSLWTIPLEIRWYVILGLLGTFGLLKYRWLLLIAVLIFAFYVFGFCNVEHNSRRVFNQEFGLFFLYGVCMHVFRSVWQSKYLLTGIVIWVLALVFWCIEHQYIALFIALPYSVILFGNASTPFLRKFGGLGDLSYGFYIYAFPVQQTIVWLTKNKISFINGLAIATVCTMALALASWHLIEKPALSLKRFLKPKERD